LCGFADVGLASIGLFVLPSALLFIVAGRLTPPGPAAAATT
jgi:hypothetical protein